MINRTDIGIKHLSNFTPVWLPEIKKKLCRARLVANNHFIKFNTCLPCRNKTYTICEFLRCLEKWQPFTSEKWDVAIATSTEDQAQDTEAGAAGPITVAHPTTGDDETEKPKRSERVRQPSVRVRGPE